jgi:hypothetical protein
MQNDLQFRAELMQAASEAEARRNAKMRDAKTRAERDYHSAIALAEPISFDFSIQGQFANSRALLHNATLLCEGRKCALFNIEQEYKQEGAVIAACKAQFEQAKDKRAALYELNGIIFRLRQVGQRW